MPLLGPYASTIYEKKAEAFLTLPWGESFDDWKNADKDLLLYYVACILFPERDLEQTDKKP